MSICLLPRLQGTFDTNIIQIYGSLWEIRCSSISPPVPVDEKNPSARLWRIHAHIVLVLLTFDALVLNDKLRVALGKLFNNIDELLAKLSLYKAMSRIEMHICVQFCKREKRINTAMVWKGLNSSFQTSVITLEVLFLFETGYQFDLWKASIRDSVDFVKEIKWLFLVKV